jgi:peptidoglycan LD-endopeptidase CwlK
MASHDPGCLTDELAAKWRQFSVELESAGYRAILTCTYRSNEEQARLYAQGRTRPGKIVTWAKPGRSLHNVMPARAFDIAILENGKLNWNERSAAWKLAKSVGQKLGLVQLKGESCHFQKP